MFSSGCALGRKLDKKWLLLSFNVFLMPLLSTWVGETRVMMITVIKPFLQI